jgi:hypothetical protein
MFPKSWREGHVTGWATIVTKALEISDCRFWDDRFSLILRVPSPDFRITGNNTFSLSRISSNAKLFSLVASPTRKIILFWVHEWETERDPEERDFGTILLRFQFYWQNFIYPCAVGLMAVFRTHFEETKTFDSAITTQRKRTDIFINILTEPILNSTVNAGSRSSIFCFWLHSNMEVIKHNS